jgi:LPS-assembly lipoprotein
MKTLLRTVLAGLLLLAVAACGFQLRGSFTLPFETLHIALPSSTELHGALKRTIEGSTATRISDNPKTAQATLSITVDQQAKNILSLNSAGRVREFQLVRTVAYRVHDAGIHDLLPPGRIVIQREFTFNDQQVLAKDAEEGLIWKEIQADLVQQILRRLATAKPLPPTED